MSNRLRNVLARVYWYLTTFRALKGSHQPCRHCYFRWLNEKRNRWLWLWCDNDCNWGNE